MESDGDIVDAQHLAVDRSTYAEIAGAVTADLVASTVVVVIKGHEGKETRETRHFPAGVAIVRRR